MLDGLHFGGHIPKPLAMSSIRSFEEDDIAHFSGRRVHVARVEDLIRELEHSAAL